MPLDKQNSSEYIWLCPGIKNQQPNETLRMSLPRQKNPKHQLEFSHFQAEYKTTKRQKNENNICMHTHIQFQLHGIFLHGNHMEERPVDRLERKQKVAYSYSGGQDAVQEDEWLEELSLE